MPCYHLMLFSSFIPNAALSASNTKSLQQKDFQHLWCKEKKSRAILRGLRPLEAVTCMQQTDRTKTFSMVAVAQQKTINYIISIRLVCRLFFRSLLLVLFSFFRRRQNSIRKERSQHFVRSRASLARSPFLVFSTYFFRNCIKVVKRRPFLAKIRLLGHVTEIDTQGWHFRV